MGLIRVFAQGGPVMFPILLIGLVLAGLVARILWNLQVKGGADGEAIQSCLGGLLFWGVLAVVIGALGSALGYHKAMTAIVESGVVNPRLVWIGAAEGMVSSTLAYLLPLGFFIRRCTKYAPVFSNSGF